MTTGSKKTKPGPYRYDGPDTPIHPGEYIREELEARGWTQVKLAKLMDRPARLVNDLCQERRSVSAETALDLAKALGMSPKTWMNLQTSYDLAKAQEKRGGEVERTSAAG